MMTETKLNLYQKINQVKLAISKANLKKSWKNKFAWFDYYELGDFLPFITEKCNEIGLYNHIHFKEDGTGATLTIIDCDNDANTIGYFTPLTDLELKGCNKIQALGGVQTYARRYLYLTAYDICESDSFDAVVGDGKKNEEVKKTTEEKLVEAKEKNIEMLYKGFKERVEHLDLSDEKAVENILQEWRNLVKYGNETMKKEITEICIGIKNSLDLNQENNDNWNNA